MRLLIELDDGEHLVVQKDLESYGWHRPLLFIQVDIGSSVVEALLRAGKLQIPDPSDPDERAGRFSADSLEEFNLQQVEDEHESVNGLPT